MDTAERFVSLAKLLPTAVPCFAWVTGTVATVFVISVCRESLLSRPIPRRGTLALAAMFAVPFGLLWLAARIVHESERAAPLWPSLVLWTIVLATLAAGGLVIRGLSAWKGTLASMFALQFWLVLSTGFVAELSVSGDYFRWFR